MNLFIESFKGAIKLLIGFDTEVYGIIFLSIGLSLTSTFLSSLVGIPLGLVLGIKDFKFKKSFTRLLYTLMSLPPVVIGLVVAMMLSRNGPFGPFELIFTPAAMVIAQTVLITPIITGIVFNQAKDNGQSVREIGLTLGANRIQLIWLLMRELKITLLIAIVSGFGRAVSEVGAVMIVGGNIKGHTRVMTTYIAMNNSMGNYNAAIAMGIVLLLIAFSVNSVLYRYMDGK
ncbi:MAG TPA: tungstate transporter permease [Clostridiales bacterium UBA8960]|nr:tungstate transporter permease [Clostridiales bacterium UBA8960]